MKKIITLILMTAGTISFATAQSKKDMGWNDNKQNGQHSNQSVGYGNNSYNDSYFSAAREKEFKLKKIDAAYDQKIAAVKYNRRMNNREKARQIQMLEKQKKAEIFQVEQQFAKSSHDYSKGRGRDNKKW